MLRIRLLTVTYKEQKKKTFFITKRTIYILSIKLLKERSPWHLVHLPSQMRHEKADIKNRLHLVQAGRDVLFKHKCVYTLTLNTYTNIYLAVLACRL